MGKKPTAFFWVATALLLFNLLVSNDYTTLWSGPESLLAWQALHAEAGPTLHEQLLASVGRPGAINLFLLRLPGVLVLSLSLLLFYVLLRPLLGRQHMANTLLLAAASLLITNLAKVGAGDIWALSLQGISLALLLRYLKQPKRAWQLAFYLVFPLAIWVQPLQSLIFLLGTAAYLYRLHPDGKQLARLNPWVSGLVAALGLYLLQWLDLPQYSFLIGWDTLTFLLVNAAGVLPFLGLVMAGIYESYKRSRQGEELALILSGAALFALLGHALALQLVLAMIAGKQLKSYFAENYPYRNIVITGTVLQLVAAACGLILFMMYIFVEFRGLGYRAALAAGGVYWMLSFVGVVGLLGKRELYARTGIVFSGLLLTTLFWLQLNPLLESKRNWAERLPAESRELKGVDADTECLVLPAEGTAFPNLAAYCKVQFTETVLVDSIGQLVASRQARPQTLCLLPEDALEKTGLEVQDTARFEGWNNRLQPVIYRRLQPE